MARKNVLNTELVASQSLATSFTTEPTIVKFLDNCSYQINITTTNSTGTFAVQVSNDYLVSEPTDTVINPGTWNALPIGGTPTVSAANDVITIDMNQLPFYAVRLAYTSTIAGTGTASIYITDKQIGG